MNVTEGGHAEATSPDLAGDDSDLEQSLDGLARLSTGQMSLPDLLTHVAEYAVAAIPGADGATVVLLRNGRPDTIGATADFVAQVDSVQYGLEEGPCVTAAATGVTVYSGALVTGGKWPRFGARVRRFGVHSALSLALVTPEGVLGVMTVYARAENAFDDRAVHVGELFAVPAAIAVQNAQSLAQAFTLARQLKAAQTNRSVIDRAVSILMSRSGSTPDEALGSLTVLSQKENRTVAIIAEEIVAGAVGRARALHHRH